MQHAPCHGPLEEPSRQSRSIHWHFSCVHSILSRALMVIESRGGVCCSTDQMLDKQKKSRERSSAEIVVMSKYQRFHWCPTSTWVVSVLRELRYKWDLLLVPFYEKWRLDMILFMKLFTPNWSGNLCPKMVVKVQHFFLEHSNLPNALCLCSKNW